MKLKQALEKEQNSYFTLSQFLSYMASHFQSRLSQLFISCQRKQHKVTKLKSERKKGESLSLHHSMKRLIYFFSSSK